MNWKRAITVCAVATFTLFALVSCGDKGTNSSGKSSFTVSAGSGTSPQYTWSAGDAFSISVMRTSDPTVIVWGLSSVGNAEKITSPTTHGAQGSLTNGTVNTFSTERVLTTGVEYRVSVTRLDGKTGWTEFTAR